MRILIVGLGSIGRRHLVNIRTLRPHDELSVWRQHGQRLVSEEITAAADHIVHTLKDALCTKPQAAIVANPATLHVETGIALGTARVPLFIEKPISDSVQSARVLVDACRQNNVPLTIGYNLRWYKPLQLLRQAYLEGLIGDGLVFRAQACRHLADWRPESDYRQSVSARSELGGGVLLELSHEIDYARWIMGEIQTVVAQVVRVGGLEIDVEDTATLLLSFSGGAVGTIHLNMVERPAVRGCRIVGTLGSLEWDAESHEVRHFSNAQGTWTRLYAGSGKDYSEAYLSEIEQFLGAVEGSQSAMVTGEDALRTLQVVAAAKKSASDGCKVTL
jgi:predicted dehydrogenase